MMNLGLTEGGTAFHRNSLQGLFCTPRSTVLTVLTSMLRQRCWGSPSGHSIGTEAGWGAGRGQRCWVVDLDSNPGLEGSEGLCCQAGEYL